MNPASRASQAIEEGLYDRPKSLWSSTTEELEIEPLDTMAGGIKGYTSLLSLLVTDYSMVYGLVNDWLQVW